MLNKVVVLILAGLIGPFLLVQSAVQAQTVSSVPAPVVADQPNKEPKKKTSSGFQLFNLKLPGLSTPKKVEKYRLCAKRKGICKCQKASDEPGILTVMDPIRCTPPPPIPVVQAPPLEDKKSIKEIQKLLKRAGYKPGRADGSMGPKTKTAIEAFQGETGLQQNGIPSAPLLTTLRTGRAKVEEVKKQAKLAALATAAAAQRAKPVDPKTQKIITVQNKLNHLGYKAGEADGAIGSKTIKAIRQFQTKNNMRADGKINDKLLQRLSDLAPDKTSQPVYASNSTQLPDGSAPAKPSTNPLAGLFGSLGSSTSTNVGLPNSMKGYRNCALRTGKCLCQKQTDDPGDWTTMHQDVCKRPPPTAPGLSANLIAAKPQPNAADNLGNKQKTSGPVPQEKIKAPSSFFDSIAKILTPEK